MTEQKTKMCSLCGQPTQLGHLHGEAVVVHWDCAKKAMDTVKKDWESADD
jgi:hypothetical protein